MVDASLFWSIAIGCGIVVLLIISIAGRISEQQDITQGNSKKRGPLVREITYSDYSPHLQSSDQVKSVFRNRPKAEPLEKDDGIEPITKNNHKKVSTKCNFCHKKFHGVTDYFDCSYCDGEFCSSHRLPEKHDCNGNPQPPRGGVREIHSRGSIWASGHEEGDY